MRGPTHHTKGLRASSLACAALALGAVGCTGYEVVSPELYRYASQPTTSIVKEMSDESAIRTLRALGRAELTSSDAPATDEMLEEALTDPDRTITSDPTSLSVTFHPIVAGSNGAPATRSATTTKTLTVGLRKGDAPENIAALGPYFSTLTAIAVEEGLEPTAIPGLAVGYRPKWSELPGWINWGGMFDGLEDAAAGIDLLVGGAVAPGGSGDGDVELALGLGLSFPWANDGALSVGAVTWRSEIDGVGDTEIAAYFGLNLGSFQVTKGAK